MLTVIPRLSPSRARIGKLACNQCAHKLLGHTPQEIRPQFIHVPCSIYNLSRFVYMVQISMGHLVNTAITTANDITVDDYYCGSSVIFCKPGILRSCPLPANLCEAHSQAQGCHCTKPTMLQSCLVTLIHNWHSSTC